MKVPKLKTKKGAKKRFKFTASGKIKRKKAYLRHILGAKGSKGKRHLRQAGYVAAVDAGHIRQIMPYG